MKNVNAAKSSTRRRLRLFVGVALLGIVGGIVAFIWPSPKSKGRIELTYITWTNNGFERVVLFEITNHTEGDFEWSLHTDGRSIDSRIAVTELMEPNGELRHIGSGGPLNLAGHDSLLFATDELHPGERIWVSIRTYPTTSADRRRQWLSAWLYRFGWRTGAFWSKPGARVDGPTLPEPGTWKR